MMSFFFPPPPQTTGTAQPFAPSLGNVAAESQPAAPVLISTAALAMTAVLAWQPAVAAPQQSRPHLIVSVDNPPPRLNGGLVAQVLPWFGPDPAPQQRRAVQLQSVDPPPPRGSAIFTPFAIADPPPQQPRPGIAATLPQPGATVQPIVPPWLSSVLAWHLPKSGEMLQRTGFVPQPSIPPPVNNPPPGQPNAWLSTVLQAWWAPAPPLPQTSSALPAQQHFTLSANRWVYLRPSTREVSLTPSARSVTLGVSVRWVIMPSDQN